MRRMARAPIVTREVTVLAGDGRAAAARESGRELPSRDSSATWQN
jgi:hypothetical protein